MLSRRSTMLAVLAALAALALQAPAIAQPSEAPRAETLKPSDRMISMEDARRIATENGVARVEEIKFDAGHWKIEGRDSLGSVIELNLRASDGTVLRMERERPASARAGN